MKDLALNLLANWANTLRSWVDGDVFRESNIDLYTGSIGDRLGWLKTAVEARVKLAGNNNIQGTQVFSTGSVTFAVPVTGVSGLTINGGATSLLGTTVTSLTIPNGRGGIKNRILTLADANTTLVEVNHDQYRIPENVDARIYTFTDNADYDGRTVTIVRPRATDNFSVRIKRSGDAGNNLFQLPANTAGWCMITCDAGVWKIGPWSHSASGIDPNV